MLLLLLKHIDKKHQTIYYKQVGLSFGLFILVFYYDCSVTFFDICFLDMYIGLQGSDTLVRYVSAASSLCLPNASVISNKLFQTTCTILQSNILYVENRNMEENWGRNNT